MLASLHNHWNSTSPACTLHLPRGVCGCPWPHNITSRPCVATAGSSRGTQRCSFRGSQRSGSAAVGVRGVSSKSKRATYQLGSSAARQLGSSAAPGALQRATRLGDELEQIGLLEALGLVADGRRRPQMPAWTGEHSEGSSSSEFIWLAESEGCLAESSSGGEFGLSSIECPSSSRSSSAFEGGWGAVRSSKVRRRLRLATRPGRWVHRATARGVASCGFSIVSIALVLLSLTSCGRRDP